MCRPRDESSSTFVHSAAAALAAPADRRAVLWDLDGTIVDTAAQHFAAWQTALAGRDVDLTPEMFVRTFGRRNADVLRDILGESLGEDEIRRLGTAKEEDYRARVRAADLQPLPGVANWLARLRATGWRQAIASSAPYANITAIFDGLDLRDAFDAITGDEDVVRGKPDPQVFLIAAAKLHVPPHRSIVVEDAPAGIEAARRAGMRAVGVRSGHKELDADFVVDTLVQLPDDAFDRLLALPPLPAP
jgi:HAD superfamily hydrolase (TIGR01509 family)